MKKCVLDNFIKIFKNLVCCCNFCICMELQETSQKSTSYWQNSEIVINQSDLTFELIDDLFSNKYAALRIKNFLTERECQDLAEAALNFGFDNYEDVYPPIGRIGITQFEAYQKPKDYYFDKVGEAFSKTDSIYAYASINVIDRLITLLQTHSPLEVKIPEESTGEKYFCGLFRYIQKAFLHFDFAGYDAKDWDISNIRSQIAWNTYIKVPERGGDNIVYERTWDESLGSQYYLPGCSGSYGFKHDIIEEKRFHKIKPILGDLLLFNSRNFHEVEESSGERLSISSFMGRRAEEIILWS